MPVGAFPRPDAFGRAQGHRCRECLLEHGRRWRAKHRAYFEAYNASRRKGPSQVCARCHEPFEEVLTVVKTGKAERERLARPPLVPKFWPRNVLSYDDLRRARAR